MDSLRQTELAQENTALLEWKQQGEAIMAQAGVGFRLGAWWADRPWRPTPISAEIVRLAGVALHEMPRPSTDWHSCAKAVCEAVVASKSKI